MANAKTIIEITHGSEAYQTIVDKLLKPQTKVKEQLVAIRNFFHAAAGGDRDCKLTTQIVSGAGVKASSTVTVLSAAIGDTAVVNGVTFTAVDHKEKTDITYAADSSGSKNSTYYLFQDQSGAYKYYVWFNINAAGVDPQIAGRVGIKVSGATGASAATLATATVTACAGTTSAKITFGADVSGSLNNTYIKFQDIAGRNKYYFWFNINGAGVDPAPAGYIGIQVAGATNAAAATLATAAFTAANAIKLSGFNVVNPSSAVVNIFGAGGLPAIVIDSVLTPTNFVVVQGLQGVAVSAGSSGHAIIQNTVAGSATATADGAGTSTGFTFTHSITGSPVSSVQYDIGLSDTNAATNLAAAINAKSSMVQVATATSSAAVVTVSSWYSGPIGNLITLTATTGNTAANSTLQNGALATTNSAVNTYHSGV